jgi:diamine N-acetyltransferase
LTSVRIVPIDGGNWRDALAVRVTPEQLPLVADHQPLALVILAKAYVRPGGLDWEPLAIVGEAGRTLGVLVLAHGTRACEMQHFAIDAAHQGQGMGARALSAVIEHVRSRRPECREMSLTVHPTNHPAQRLYSRAGFADTGARRDGEPVWTLLLERADRGA